MSKCSNPPLCQHYIDTKTLLILLSYMLPNNIQNNLTPFRKIVRISNSNILPREGMFFFLRDFIF